MGEIDTKKEDCPRPGVSRKHIVTRICSKLTFFDFEYKETISRTKNYNKRELGKLLKKVQKDDLIVCAELSRLG